MACGVLGIALKSESDEKSMRKFAESSLKILNHRGEEAHGIAFIDESRHIKAKRSSGLVRDSHIFEPNVYSPMLIGHTRYATSSFNDIANAQPIYKWNKDMDYAICHNGNIANDALLRKELGINNEKLSDTHVLYALLTDALRKREGMEERMHDALERINGSYSIAILLNQEVPVIIAVRDKFGYMPLSVGENEHGRYVASESVVFGRNYLNAESREVRPGEMVVISREGMSSYQLFNSERQQFCMFQWIYMCRPESFFEGRNVYLVRKMLGAMIAVRYRPDVEYVMPIPDSGIAVAAGYSMATGLPMEMGIVKDRYESRRSFMQNDQKGREEVLNKKLNVIGEVVRGRKILLMDDSLVRGITTRNTVKMLREAGAKEVHMAFSCPPIVSGCSYGIDFYNEQLIARPQMGKNAAETNKAMAEAVGADSLYYITLSDLSDVIGSDESRLCLSCLTGKYAQQLVMTSEKERRG